MNEQETTLAAYIKYLGDCKDIMLKNNNFDVTDINNKYEWAYLSDKKFHSFTFSTVIEIDDGHLFRLKNAQSL